MTTQHATAEVVKTYTVHGVGNFGPAHPLYNPACVVTLLEDGVQVGRHTAQDGMAAHRYGLEHGYSLPEGHRFIPTVTYQSLLAEIRYKESGL